MEKLYKNRDWLRKHGIQIRNISEARKLLFKNGYINPFKDKHHTPETRESISKTRKLLFKNGYIHPLTGNPREDMRNDKHPNWKGDKAGVIPIHGYVRSRKPKPEDGKCVLCSKMFGEKGISKLELSFINHSKEYTRNPEDYQWAHHSCHLHYDKEQRILKKSIQNLNQYKS